MIRLLIAEDSEVIAKILWQTLETDPEIEVVGVAKTGKEAIEKTKALKPDIVSMDIHMPEMDGLEATKQIMAYCPVPILILSASVFKEGPEKSFEAIYYGALDVMEKHGYDKNVINVKARDELIDKVKMLSRIKVVTHPLGKLEKQRSASKAVVIDRTANKNLKVDNKIVAVASSTGGPQALVKIFKEIPAPFTIPIVLVQHISEGFSEIFADWLSKESKHTVKVAEMGEDVKPGCIYLAPTGAQMRVDESRKISLNKEEKVDGQQPSGTVLLQSVSDIYGAGCMGVVLTGMGRDGAEGLKAIKDVEGQTIAQDEQSCVVFGMPGAAVEIDAAEKIVPLDSIAHYITAWGRDS